ncbi:MAG: polysulfide reductase NrfD [Betaproteobacteria bacterium]|nr:polysulfide reductase NrfD [Betaproteobacteria bacterium]
MSRETYSRLEARGFWALAFLGAAVALAGFLAAHAMETSGHVITGMNNQVVWGVPHVFAIFMIVAASGVLNVASIGSVFGHAAYKARAPLSGLLCLALLSGGLFVLMLDLGRPERVVVAATHYNFRSVFAWNVFLYSGMFTIVAVYLWTLMERRMAPWSKPAGLAAFVWRIILTSGTGSIFAFLVARQAYGTALLIPMFLAMSFAWGLAAFLVVQSTMYAWNGLALPADIQRRMRNLLALFVVTVLFLVAVLHLVNGYFAKNLAFERFILADGGVYPVLFWGAYVVAGSLVPLALIWRPGSTARDLVVAALLVIAGAFALLYVFIVGGQAWPLDIFPGYTTSSTFGDGAIASYAPSLPEVLLGVGGLAVAFLITVVGVRALRFLPQDDLPAAPVAAPAGR